jgi:hypothetical protein
MSKKSKNSSAEHQPSDTALSKGSVRLQALSGRCTHLQRLVKAVLGLWLGPSDESALYHAAEAALGTIQKLHSNIHVLICHIDDLRTGTGVS